MLGYKKDAILGGQIPNFPFIPKESKRIIKENFIKRREGKIIPPYEVRFITKKGKDLWAEITVQTIKNTLKEIIGSFVMMIDITKHKEAELKMKKMENQQRQILDSIPAIIFLKNLKNNIIEANQTFIRTTGLSKKELIGKNHQKVWPKATKKYWGSDDKKIIKSKKSKIGIIQEFETLKGKKWFKTDKILYRDERGKISGIIGFSTDITKEKTIGIKYETLFKTLLDAVMFLKPPTWRFTSGNPATLKMFKLKDEKEFTSHTPDYYSSKYQPNGELSSIKAKKEILKAMKKGRNIFEWTHKRKGDEEFPAIVWLEKVGINGQEYLQATVRDITEQKRKEENLRREKEMSEKYLNTAGIMLGVIDANANIVMINKKGCNVLDYKEKDLLGKNWIKTLVPKRQKKEVEKFFNKLVSGKIYKIESFENELLTKKGKEKTFIFNNNIIRDLEDKVTGVLFSAVDITERKRTEKEIKEKTNQLERMNEFFLNREERIIELKNKIKKLERRYRTKKN